MHMALYVRRLMQCSTVQYSVPFGTAVWFTEVSSVVEQVSLTSQCACH
jgi:hypothetical protein